jgi:hypothetical protein
MMSRSLASAQSKERSGESSTICAKEPYGFYGPWSPSNPRSHPSFPPVVDSMGREIREDAIITGLKGDRTIVALESGVVSRL